MTQDCILYEMPNFCDMADLHGHAETIGWATLCPVVLSEVVLSYKVPGARPTDEFIHVDDSIGRVEALLLELRQSRTGPSGSQSFSPQSI